MAGLPILYSILYITLDTPPYNALLYFYCILLVLLHALFYFLYYALHSTRHSTLYSTLYSILCSSLYSGLRSILGSLLNIQIDSPTLYVLTWLLGVHALGSFTDAAQDKCDEYVAVVVVVALLLALLLAGSAPSG